MVVLTLLLVKAAYDRYQQYQRDSLPDRSQGEENQNLERAGYIYVGVKVTSYDDDDDDDDIGDDSHAPFHPSIYPRTRPAHSSSSSSTSSCSSVRRRHRRRIPPRACRHRHPCRCRHRSNSIFRWTTRRILLSRDRQSMERDDAASTILLEGGYLLRPSCPGRGAGIVTLPPERRGGDDEEEESVSVATEAASRTTFHSDSNLNSNLNSKLSLNSKGTEEASPPPPPSTTTFRNDVRQEWIDAVFGPDFFPLSEEDKDDDDDDNNNDGRIDDDELKVRQGVGAANLPHYVTYGVRLAPPPIASHSQSQSQLTPQESRIQNSWMHSRKKQQPSSRQPQPQPQPQSQSTLFPTQFAQSTPICISPSSLEENLSLVASTSWGVDSPSPPTSLSPEEEPPVDIPSPSPKLGMTIARLPLGLYVRSVRTDSEAFAAGIRPGSVLVEVNGLGMLGETSHKALERLWSYEFGGCEGLLGGTGIGGNTTTAGEADDPGIQSDNGTDGENTSNANNHGNIHPNNPSKATDLRARKPLLLKLHHRGRTLTALLLSGRPLSGIEWAPCGNFALVRRSSGLAAAAGVRRGCLLVAVDRRGLRSLDHAGMAARLTERFRPGRGEFAVTLGYTPAASRSGFAEREGGGVIDGAIDGAAHDDDNDGRDNGIRVADLPSRGGRRVARDVEIRSRPVEYGTAVADALFACTGPSAMAAVLEGGDSSAESERANGGDGKHDNNDPDSNHTNKHNNNHTALDDREVMLELAAYVAAGGILPTPGGVTAAAAKIAAFRRQNPSDHAVSVGRDVPPCPTVDPTRLFLEWDSLASLSRSMAFQAAGCCETDYAESGGPFRRWDAQAGDADANQRERGGDMAGELANHLRVVEGIAKTGIAEEVFDAHLLQLLGVAIAPRFASVGERLFDILIDVALNDINLCQRLFFVLRSFIGALDLPTGTTHTNGEESASAMKLLRYTQRRLSGRMFDKSFSMEEDRHCSEGYPISRESSSSSRLKPSYSQLSIAPSESSINNDPLSPISAPVSAPETTPRGDDPANRATATESLEESLKLLEMEESTPSLAEVTLPPLHGSTQPPSNESAPAPAEEGSKKKSKSKRMMQMLKAGKSKLTLKKTAPPNGGKPPSSAGSPPKGKLAVNKKSPSKILRKQSSKSDPPSQPSQPVPSLDTIDGVLKERPQIENLDGRDEPCALPPMSRLFDNMSWILRQIDNTCMAIEKNLIKSFPQKMADWALHPWSASKESALTAVTLGLKTELRRMNNVTGSDSEGRFPVLNPVDPSEILTSVDADECFILPSAHFPMLLCFNSRPNPGNPSVVSGADSHHGCSRDTVYRVKVELVSLRSPSFSKNVENGSAYAVQGVLSGILQESGSSVCHLDSESRDRVDSKLHRWTAGGTLQFETRSNWGVPKSLSLNVSIKDNASFLDDKSPPLLTEIGCGFVDLSEVWNVNHSDDNMPRAITQTIKIRSYEDAVEFDQHGEADEFDTDEAVELQLRVTGEILSTHEQPQKRLLLYKHGDDLRQELLAIQFIERCNQMLKASGLDLKLKTFRCLPVGAMKGFIEWVSGTVPLSELCQSTGNSYPGSRSGSRSGSRAGSSWSNGGPTELKDALDSSSSRPNEGVDLTEGSQERHRGWCKYQLIRGLRQKSDSIFVDNPIQDFLRSAAYDEYAPYFVKKDVIDTYVKSCAGYCVVTYLLGVGDRHLDNILLHQNGHLIHCDYSYILGNDPKTYLPMRITEDMIKGFGGRESDNYAKFLSCTGAAFLVLRRHNNLHSLLSQIRSMAHSNMRDVSLNQPPEEAVFAMRGRFRLDLSDDDALAYIEDVVERSIASKMWRAVDVIHTLGKHF